MLALDWALLAYALYVPALLILYLLEVIAIFKHRNTSFNSSFFRTFSALAVVNTAACLVGSFVFRFNLYPIVNGFYGSLLNNSGWLTAAYSLAYYFNCLSEFLGVFLAFNRFTTLYFPMLHDRFWRWALSLGITLCLLVSVIPVCHLFDDANMFAEMVEASLGYKWYYLDDVSATPQASIWFNMFIVTVVCNSISSLLYGACFIRLCMFSVARNFTIERNFFLVGFLTMIFSLPYCFAMLTFYLNLSIAGAKLDVDLVIFIAFQLPWLTDLKYLAPAPMLLLTNKSIRCAIKQLFWGNSAKISSVNASVSHARTVQVSTRS